jgi:hypothetical protein
MRSNIYVPHFNIEPYFWIAFLVYSVEDRVGQILSPVQLNSNRVQFVVVSYAQQTNWSDHRLIFNLIASCYSQILQYFSVINLRKCYEPLNNIII